MAAPRPEAAAWPAPQQAEAAYSPSSCIGGNYAPFVAAYRSRSQAARERCAALGATWQRCAYGAAPAQAIELMLPPRPARSAGAAARQRALLVYVHGGYWQELSAGESLWAAASCLENGHAFAAIDYTLAPAARLEQIVDECRAAMRWLQARADALGIDAARIVVAGSSAGAHLAAMVALPDARPAPVLPRAAVLVSGVYWLEPLVGTSINAALGLDAARARALSPGLQRLQGFAPSMVCWGEVETDAFKAQGRGFAAALAAAGSRCETIEIAARNHFDVVLDLADGNTALGRWTLARLAGA